MAAKSDVLVLLGVTGGLAHEMGFLILTRW
jgi:hypothetical protein